MKTPGIKFRRYLTGLALLALLTACAVAPQPMGPEPVEASRARRAEAAGRHIEAAELWVRAADLAGDPNRQVYRLRAAEAWMFADRRNEARSALDAVDDSLLPPDELSRYALLQAELALVEADAEKADFYLQVARPGLDRPGRARFLELQRQLQRLRADPASYALATAARALSAMGPYDTGKGVALLQLLEDVPSGRLASMAEEPPGTPALDGWPQLALHMRRALVSGADLVQAAADWTQAHPGHVVSATEFLALGSSYRQLFSPPPQVAVLLPLEGSLATAASAIRDGLLSAYLDNPQRATIRLYATGDDPQSAVSAYFDALNAGAQWIIGPLRRESVQALAQLGSLGAPALVLNQVRRGDDGRANGSLFSLALSQEAEARAVARKALELGNLRVMTLAVDSSWGHRMEAAFVEEFEAGGGRIVVSGRFPPVASDHGALLTGLLRIDASRDRKNRLQATLGLPLSFEPTRRDDFDFIFLAAGPEQGRQIKPQLSFYDTGDKPVLAMGRIFSGSLDPAADLDMNGIGFPSTAWQQAAGQEFPMPGFRSIRDGGLGHLFALGMDAWNLLPWLPLLQKDPDLEFPGAVGALRLTPGGNLLREPAWSVFSGGRPVAAHWPAAED